MSQSQKWWSMGLLPLREELKSKGLETHGSKPVLVRRLEVYDERLNVLKSKSTPVQIHKSPVKSESSTNSGEKESKGTVQTEKTTTDNTQSAPMEQQDNQKPKDWWTLSMQELKNECSKRNLSFMGNKYTLVNRLKGYDAQQKVPTTEGTPTVKNCVTSEVPALSGPGSKLTPTKPDTVPTQKSPKTTPTATAAALKATAPNLAKDIPANGQSKSDSQLVEAEMDRIGKLTLAQLKIECVNKKLNISGSRTELLERLQQHLSKGPSVNKPTTVVSKPLTSVVSPPSSVPSPVKPQGGAVTTVQSPQVTAVKAKATGINWSPVAQKPPSVVPTQAHTQIEVAPVKKVITTSLGVQTENTEDMDRPQPVKNLYVEEQVEIAKKFSSKPPFWEDKSGKFPDVFLDYFPVKETERRARSLVMYPMTYKDIQDPAFNKVRQTARSCVINFTDEKSLNRALKGSAELEFFTLKACQNADEKLKKWRKDLKVETLSQHPSLDAVLVKLGKKPGKLEPTANRLLFLNKLPMKLREGNLAEKFSDAASICIAKDTLKVSKGYAFVEFASSSEAQIAYSRNKNLYLEGTRIDVTLYPKVPANLEQDKNKLVMPDCERVKLSEKHHQTTLDFNKAKSGPYNRDRTNDQSLLKEMSILEEKLAVDAAIRKKLGYISLPEPVGFMSTEMRKAWQTGDFSSFKVDLGGIHKDWGEPKTKPVTKEEKPSPGPTPAKVSKMDDSSKKGNVPVKREEKLVTSLAATLSQLKETEVDNRKRKEPPNSQPNRWNRPDNSSLPQETGGRWQQKTENRGQQSSWNQQKDSLGPNTGGSVGWNQRGSDNQRGGDQRRGDIQRGGDSQRGGDIQGGMKGGRNVTPGFAGNKTSNFDGNNMTTTESKPSRFGNQQNTFDKPKQSDFVGNLPPQFGRHNPQSSFADDEIRSNKSSLGDGQSSRFSDNQSSRFGESQSSRFGDNQLSRFGENQSSRFGENQSSRFGENQSSRFGENQPSRRFGENQSSRFGENHPSQIGDNQSSQFGDDQSLRFGENQSAQFGNKYGQQRFQDNPEKQFEKSKGSNFGKPQGATEMSGWGRGKLSSMAENESFSRKPYGRGRGIMGQDFEENMDNPSETLGRGRGSFGHKMPSAGLNEDFRKLEQPIMGRGLTRAQEGEKPRFGIPGEKKDVYAKFYGGEDVSDVISRDSFPMSFGSTKRPDTPEEPIKVFGRGGMRGGNRFGMQGRQSGQMEDMDLEDEEDVGGQSFGFGQKSLGRGSHQFGQQRGGNSRIGKGFGRGNLQKEEDDDFDEEEQMSFGRGSNLRTRIGRGINRGNIRQTSDVQGFTQLGKLGGNKSRFDDDDDNEEFGGSQSTLNQSNFGNFGRNEAFKGASQGLNKNTFRQRQGNFNQDQPKLGFGKSDTFDEGETSFGLSANRGSFGGDNLPKDQSNFGQGRPSSFGQRPSRFDKGISQLMDEPEEEEEGGQDGHYGAQSRGFQSNTSNKGQVDSLLGNPEGFRRTPGAAARGTPNQDKQYPSLMDTPTTQFGTGMRNEKGRFGNQQDSQNELDFPSSAGFNRQPRVGMGVGQPKASPPSLLGRPGSTQNKDDTRNQVGQSSLPPTDTEQPPLPQQPQQQPPQPAQPPPQQPQQPGYPEYDQKAYDEYYKYYSQAGYDYSQYGYGAYGQPGQGDWTQGYWGYPFSQPPPPASKPSEDGSQTQQPADTDKTGQWGSYGYGQQPPTSQQSATSTPSAGAAGQQPWSKLSQGEPAQGAEETVNTELIKKLGPAVSTLRQQMQYDTKEKKADNSNMPTFVSNMASFSSNKTQGYGGQYAGYQ